MKKTFITNIAVDPLEIENAVLRQRDAVWSGRVLALRDMLLESDEAMAAARDEIQYLRAQLEGLQGAYHLLFIKEAQQEAQLELLIRDRDQLIAQLPEKRPAFEEDPPTDSEGDPQSNKRQRSL